MERSAPSRIAQLSSSALTGGLVLCALVVTGLAVERRLNSPPDPRRKVMEAQRDWLDYAAFGQRVGPVDAPIVVVNFFDYQCPACRALEARLDSAMTRWPGQISVLYRHYPIAPIHPHAVAAAVASECAAVAGRFEPMHRLLFAHGDSLAILPWTQLARRAGVTDTSAFAVCLTRTEAVEAVRRDQAAGDRLKVRGTPTLLVNGTRITGVVPQAILDSIFASALTTVFR